MDHLSNEVNQSHSRRQRLHEILIALINQQGNLELIDAGVPHFDKGGSTLNDVDPAKWMDRNKRILKRYESLVRSAIALDALLESEQCEL